MSQTDLVNISVEEAVELLAKRACVVRLVKAAGLFKSAGAGAFFGDIGDALKNPVTQWGLGGAALGGLAGAGSEYLNEDPTKEKHPWRSALTGALAGGAAGAGIRSAFGSTEGSGGWGSKLLSGKGVQPNDLGTLGATTYKQVKDLEGHGAVLNPTFWNQLRPAQVVRQLSEGHFAQPLQGALTSMRGWGSGAAGSALYNLGPKALRWSQSASNPLSHAAHNPMDYNAFFSGIQQRLGAEHPVTRMLAGSSSLGQSIAEHVMRSGEQLPGMPVLEGRIMGVPARAWQRLQNQHPETFNYLMDLAGQHPDTRRMGGPYPGAATPVAPESAWTPRAAANAVSELRQHLRTAMTGQSGSGRVIPPGVDWLTHLPEATRAALKTLPDWPSIQQEISTFRASVKDPGLSGNHLDLRQLHKVSPTLAKYLDPSDSTLPSAIKDLRPPESPIHSQPVAPPAPVDAPAVTRANVTDSIMSPTNINRQGAAALKGIGPERAMDPVNLRSTLGIGNLGTFREPTEPWYGLAGWVRRLNATNPEEVRPAGSVGRGAGVLGQALAFGVPALLNGERDKDMDFYQGQMNAVQKHWQQNGKGQIEDLLERLKHK